jgi:hypothetical protein
MNIYRGAMTGSIVVLEKRIGSIRTSIINQLVILVNAEEAGGAVVFCCDNMPGCLVAFFPFWFVFLPCLRGGSNYNIGKDIF